MTYKGGSELSAEETPPKDSSISEEEATTLEQERAPEEGKQEDEQNCKAKLEGSKVDGFDQNSSGGVLENPVLPAGSDCSSSCDTSLTDQAFSVKEEEGQNSKAETDGSDADGFDENSPAGVLENSVLSSDSDKSSSTYTPLMDQTVAPLKNEDVQDSKAEPDDIKVDCSCRNSPQGVLENAVSSACSDGGSTGDTSSVDQTVAPDKEDEQNSNNSESDDNKVDGSGQNSPRGVLENAVSSAYSDGSSGSETSSVDQTVPPYGTGMESESLNWRNLISRLITRKKRSMLRLPTFPMAMRSSSLRRALEKVKNNKDQIDIGQIAKDVGIAKPSWRSFEYDELVTATNGFSQENLIGKGGHAEVYKGSLVNGQLVAVKKLTKGDNEETRVADFLSELGIIAHVNHPNAAQLVGFSVERGLHLVLRFSAHGSLASVLHGSKESLEWKVRFKIAIGVAEGLLYLHEGCQRRIIHRDIKASNILLAEDYQPQISDFGLAKWLPDNWNHHIVFPIEGTFGYMAPEYFMHGVMNEKTDVFAFGVVLLELITGRLAVDFSRQSLVIWAKPLLEANKVSELVDPVLGDAYDLKEATRALRVASMCIHHLSTSRPRMKEVVRLLRIDDGSIELMEQASRSKVSRAPLMDAPGIEEDYTCSRYLNDLNRHKQLALEQ